MIPILAIVIGSLITIKYSVRLVEYLITRGEDEETTSS